MKSENTLGFANTLILFLDVNKQDVEYKCHVRTANRNRVKVLNSKQMTGTKLPKPCSFNCGIFQCTDSTFLQGHLQPRCQSSEYLRASQPGSLTNSDIM